MFILIASLKKCKSKIMAERGDEKAAAAPLFLCSEFYSYCSFLALLEKRPQRIKCSKIGLFCTFLHVFLPFCRTSNPLLSAIKETSFVYHGKRRFFLHFGQKQGKIKQNRASERSIGCSEALFFVSSGFPSPKTLVYFLRFLAPVKKRKKVRRYRTRTFQLSRKNEDRLRSNYFVPFM